MGCRTTIILEREPNVGVYLHWVDVEDAIKVVEAASKYARSPEDDSQYCLARIIEQAILAAGPTEETGIGVGDPREMDTSRTIYVGDEWKINVK